MPPRPLIAAFVVLALAACAADDESSGNSGTEADTTSDEARSDTGTMSGGMTMGDDDDDDDDDLTTTMGDDDDDSSSDETGPVACMDDTDCEGMGNQIFCEGDVCVDCNAAGGDAACAEADKDTPVCEAGGACVQCTAGDDSACEGTTPICDTDAFTCRECLQHSECDSGACRIPINFANDPNWGACFENVVEVPVSGVQAEFAAPFAPEGDELAVIITDDEMGAFTDIEINVDSNIDIAIIAQDGELPIFNAAATAPQITLSNNAAAWLYNVEISNNGAGGFPAISANSSQLHIQRSRIVNNDGGGISLANGARAVIESSFVGGSGGVQVPAISVAGSDASVLYSTVIGGTNIDMPAPALFCSGASDVTARNSILIAFNLLDEIDCSGLTLDYSATEADMGGTNTFVNNAMTGWFENASDDFSLQAGHPFGDVALWLEGDPTTDIDGTPRPTVDGTEDVAGAHIP